MNNDWVICVLGWMYIRDENHGVTSKVASAYGWASKKEAQDEADKLSRSTIPIVEQRSFFMQEETKNHLDAVASEDLIKEIAHAKSR